MLLPGCGVGDLAEKFWRCLHVSDDAKGANTQHDARGRPRSHDGRTCSERKLKVSVQQRRAARVIWLNPLLGNEDYRPLARGMSAALPHVNLFASAHNLASLQALGKYLAL